MTFLKKSVHLLLAIVLLATFILIPSSSLAKTNTNQAEPVTIYAKAAMVTDIETGKILYAKNIDEALGIASMTKLITAYLVYESVANGQINWTDQVKISDSLIKTTENPELSNVPLYKNQTYTVQDLLYASLISSANAATSALAEFISGSEPKFVDQMRAKMTEWGITDSFLISSSGLGTMFLENGKYPGSHDDDENRLSARDMTIVAEHLLADYPDVLAITKLSEYILFNGTKNQTLLTNSNYMLPNMPYYYAGVDGLKTGTTDLAGACFIGTIEKDGRRYISVVMGVDDEHNRFIETQKMLDYVFRTWIYQPVVTQGQSAVEPTMSVNLGKEATVPLKTDQTVSAWVNTNQAEASVDVSFEPKSNYTDGLNAPVKENKLVGYERIQSADGLGFLHAQQNKVTHVPVKTAQSIEKVNFFVEVWHKVRNFFH